ncbi:ABC transporter substrate-binding protein [Undibacterium sp. 5I1]|uniref:ABC transporter substrate-binding protein n=1 Tax=unclassified Undibacterium TaxID=2630295 RepID=UPI002AB566A5|nr:MULTISPECIES: ABC transporter substrate-binding protein [unclassified Undibacterium]MDY7540048.1 ABC transporter substrate-binding protein [Undibacterium sp. 5I1]MEB0232628.1 ABC transporter substrate-binding protein [Undibacterium sp. 10I3]MEB0257895.1 ABC transporter substrate-binding protein [Undibacterium sp. 5I1]
MISFTKSVLAAIFLSLTFFSSVFAVDNAIIVGQVIDLSGPNGSIGRDYVAGITTYFDSLNVAGGLNGRRIKYLVRDDQGDAAASAKAVTELIGKDKVDYLLGGIGLSVTNAVVASPAFKQSALTLFAPLVSSVKDYNSRVVFWRPSPEQEMQYIFSYFDKLGIKSVGIAYQESELNQEMYQYVVAEVGKRKMILSGVARISNSPVENEKEATALAAKNPGIVIVVSDTVGTGLFLKQFRKRADKTFVAGMSLINLETLAEVAGRGALEWTVFSQVVPNPLGKKTIVQIDHSAMMKKFRDEDLSSLTLEGFIVAKTLAKAIAMSKSGRDGLQLLAAQKHTLDLGGISVTPDDPSRHMSGYVDIALFRKGGGLLF